MLFKYGIWTICTSVKEDITYILNDARDRKYGFFWYSNGWYYEMIGSESKCCWTDGKKERDKWPDYKLTQSLESSRCSVALSPGASFSPKTKDKYNITFSILADSIAVRMETCTLTFRMNSTEVTSDARRRY